MVRNGEELIALAARFCTEGSRKIWTFIFNFKMSLS
jgi:hypothetical protein